jgi:DNA repair protein RecO (recombination protein O)
MMKRGCAVLATSKRSAQAFISDEPSFVLHRYPWSESSLVLEVFTRHSGRVALLAKGAKKPHSNFRSVLMPLQRLSLAYRGESEVRTLSKAEWVAAHPLPKGEALLAGFYINELILKLLARDDPHPDIFDLYAQVVEILSSGADAAIASLLRSFELLVLQNLGLLPDLDREGSRYQSLNANLPYHLHPETGLTLIESTAERRVQTLLMGSQWLTLYETLQGENTLLQTLRWCAQLEGDTRLVLQSQLRQLIHYHGGQMPFKTRQFMIDVQSLITT